MDFSKFSDEDFDIKEWINSTFTAQKDTNQNAEVNYKYFNSNVLSLNF